MSLQESYQTNPRIEEAVEELKGMVAAKYPTASFVVFDGEDPEGVYLQATVDIEDTDEVMDLVADRLLDMQVAEGLSVYLIPIRPLEHVLEELRASTKPSGTREARENPTPFYR